jgi:hypothetical protein
VQGEDGEMVVTKTLHLLPWQRMIKPPVQAKKTGYHSISNVVLALSATSLVTVVLVQMLQESMSEIVFTVLTLVSFVAVVATLVKRGFEWLLRYQLANAQAINKPPAIYNTPGNCRFPLQFVFLMPYHAEGQTWDGLMPDKVG